MLITAGSRRISSLNASLIAFLIVILLIEPDAWAITLGSAGALAYQFLNHGRSWETLLMTGILAIFLTKHARDLRQMPGLHGRLYRWVQGTTRHT